ncbi:MAG: hypothetical protein R3293_20965 [Candidatus Promineifilaceae bacterium]|nr:hypothetical protein [Candidatus Promineifilaceae bacterium]
MNSESSFKQIAAISIIVAGVLSLAANVILLLAVDFNFEFLENPEELLVAGFEPGAVELFRWGQVLGILGWCLLLIPVMLYLWYWLGPRNSGLMTLYTVLGLTSIVLCVIESTIPASIWPPMIAAYPQAADVQREVLQVIFSAVTDFAFEGMYALSSILFGLWSLGVGLVLRVERRILGIATAIMGAAILGAGFGWLLRVDPLARLELFYFFQPFWAIWLGIVIWGRGEQSEPEIEPATAV